MTRGAPSSQPSSSMRHFLSLWAPPPSPPAGEWGLQSGEVQRKSQRMKLAPSRRTCNFVAAKQGPRALQLLKSGSLARRRQGRKPLQEGWQEERGVLQGQGQARRETLLGSEPGLPDALNGRNREGVRTRSMARGQRTANNNGNNKAMIKWNDRRMSGSGGKKEEEE